MATATKKNQSLTSAQAKSLIALSGDPTAKVAKTHLEAFTKLGYVLLDGDRAHSRSV